MTESRDIAAAEPIVFDDDTRVRFIEHIAAHPDASHIKAMRDLGVRGTRGQIRAALKEQLGDEIGQVRRDVVRAELARRAIVGWDEPVYYKGEVVAEKRVYDSRLLEFLGRIWLPEAQPSLEVTGADGGPIEIEGRAVVGLADVLGLARRLGISAQLGLDSGPARGELPAAQDVLPDPPDR